MTRKKTIYSDPVGMVLKIHTIKTPQMIRFEQYDFGIDGGLSDTISIRSAQEVGDLASMLDDWINGLEFRMSRNEICSYAITARTAFSIESQAEHICIPDKTGAKKISAYLKRWAAKNG